MKKTSYLYNVILISESTSAYGKRSREEPKTSFLVVEMWTVLRPQTLPSAGLVPAGRNWLLDLPRPYLFHPLQSGSGDRVQPRRKYLETVGCCEELWSVLYCITFLCIIPRFSRRERTV